MNRSGAHDKERRTAYHEAGHAVMRLILGLPFQSVSILPEQLSGSVIENGKGVDSVFIIRKGIIADDEQNSKADEEVQAGLLNLREALTSMGGPMAESILIGTIDDEAQAGAALDIQQITDCCGAALIKEMGDDIVNLIAAGSEKLLRGNWSAVEAVAAGLLEKQELDHKTVSRIADTAGLSRRRSGA